MNGEAGFSLNLSNEHFPSPTLLPFTAINYQIHNLKSPIHPYYKLNNMKLLFSTFVLGMITSSSAVISDIVEDAKAKDDAASKNRLRGLKNDKVIVLVTLKEDKNTGIAKKCESKANGAGGSVKYVYSTVLNGCALDIPVGAMNSLKKDPEVQLLEEDGEVHATGCTPSSDGSGSCVVSPPTWGLDAMDQCAGPVNSQPFFKKPATGVRIYIADSGIKWTHQEFNGMIEENDNCHGKFIVLCSDRISTDDCPSS